MTEMDQEMSGEGFGDACWKWTFEKNTKRGEHIDYFENKT